MCCVRVSSVQLLDLHAAYFSAYAVQYSHSVFANLLVSLKKVDTEIRLISAIALS